MSTEKLEIEEKRLKKKDATEKFYNSTTQSKSFFNEKQLFIIRKRMKLHDVNHYWL